MATTTHSEPLGSEVPLPAAQQHSAGHGRNGGRASARAGLVRRLTAIGFLLVGGGLWWWLATHHFTAGGAGHRPEGADRGPAGPGAGDEARAATVTLTPEALSAAGIELATVARRPMHDALTVPGRLDYDARRRLDYGSPVDAIVSRVFVQVRQQVSKGDSLAEVSSPDVGRARDDLRRREYDRLIEKRAADWATTIAENVEKLLQSLASRPPLEAVEQQFKDLVLGSYREKILGGYSRLVYVEKVNASTKSLGEGGVLSGRIVEERTSNLEVAKANFIAACEESRFMTRQDESRAKASLEQAERLERIAREHLRMLVGSKLAEDSEIVTTGEEIPPDSRGETYAISSLVLRTPFDGIVEDVFVVAGERVQAGDRMFVVADTKKLWVRAQIHERQWTAVDVAVGQSVRVSVPGADEHHATARINHVGATVESESRSVPLVAELDNDDAHYKPGMFVWVDLPEGTTRDAMAVPASAVMRHEGKSFVFVPAGERRFRRRDVETGARTDQFLEVTGGLEPGEEVVAKGAFVLKSELLLESDDEPAQAGTARP
ncbi:MAG: efflux RND transporter periplasmic adaptor subunit [Planctomycetia bacterium]|nr:efflux RND transporter periplasmic adaptor subunit [Planctomycetia bacterium]